MPDIPQYSDFIIEFQDITYNLSSSEVDLSTVSDIVLSISRFAPYNTPILILKQSTSPGRFTVDNVEKSVAVTVTNVEMGDVAAKYYINLWIASGSTYVTHLTKTFNIAPAVNYE